MGLISSTVLNLQLRFLQVVNGHIKRFQDVLCQRNFRARKWFSITFTPLSSKTDRSIIFWTLDLSWFKPLILTSSTSSSFHSTRPPSLFSSTAKTRWHIKPFNPNLRSPTKPWEKAWWNYATLKLALWKSKMLKCQSSAQLKKSVWMLNMLHLILDVVSFQIRLHFSKRSQVRRRLRLMHLTKKSNKKEPWLLMQVLCVSWKREKFIHINN